jgi:hypothetical protein
LVKELRQRLEASRAAERTLQQAAAQAEERARGASADAKGKERLALELRARLEVGEASRSQVQEAAEQRTAEAMAEPLRRALERKEVALRSLRARLKHAEGQLAEREQQHASELAEAHQSNARCRKQLEAAAQRAQLELTQRGGAEEVHARTPPTSPALSRNCAPNAPPKRASNVRRARPPPQVKVVVRRVARSLEAGAAHPAEERQLAALSQQLLQLSPAELGLAPRADIGAPHPEAGGPSAAGGTGDTAAAAPPQREILSADLQLLETALSEPVDVHGAVTVLLRLVQRRLDAADEVATQRDRSADVEPLLQMSAALHESVRGIREQLHLEQQQSASALAERELQLLTSLHTSSSTST